MGRGRVNGRSSVEGREGKSGSGSVERSETMKRGRERGGTVGASGGAMDHALSRRTVLRGPL